MNRPRNLVQIVDNALQISSAGVAKPAERLAQFRQELARVKARAERLPTDSQLALFDVMWSELHEVLTTFHEAAEKMEQQFHSHN